MAELSLEPAMKAIDMAKERPRIINLKYNNGMASGSEVIQTRQALAQAQQTYWESWQNFSKPEKSSIRQYGENSP